MGLFLKFQYKIGIQIKKIITKLFYNFFVPTIVIRTISTEIVLSTYNKNIDKK